MHLFYQELLKKGKHVLESDEFHHCISVLRHKSGDNVHVTDGRGTLAHVQIGQIGKHILEFEVIEEQTMPSKPFHVHIGIAPTKQLDRMEWFVEKACELGTDDITFIRTHNSERPRLKLDRLERKAIGALKQSKGAYKTHLHDLTSFDDFVEKSDAVQKMIAVVGQQTPLAELASPSQPVLILIGPEGDFTSKEVGVADKHGYTPVSLGQRVLRTETAGLMALHTVNMINRY